jgi:uncharacterized membrane protein YsdA (DUF1294 family)
VSLVSFILYAYDKLQALKKSQRVSEMKLLGSSLLGGSVGSILAMLIFRHKIKKASFIIKFSLVVIIQAVGFYLYLKGYTF